MSVLLSTPADRTFVAALAVLGYAGLISFVDNLVRAIAEEAGLWQFLALRSLMALAMIGLAALPLALSLWPHRLWRVLARSALHTAGLLIYFGSLGFLSVAEAAAGLFTAPLFVLLLSRVIYGNPLGPVRVLGAFAGFAGVLLVLAPEGEILASSRTLWPVLAGALFGMGNLATREWCRGESALTLTFWYLVVIGFAGGLGVVVLWLIAPPATPDTEGFVLRGLVWPSGVFLLLTAVQAVGSVVAVMLLVRAYQLAEPGRVAVIEYVVLPFSVFWGWVLFGHGVGVVGAFGMALIIAAGALVVLYRPRVQDSGLRNRVQR